MNNWIISYKNTIEVYKKINYKWLKKENIIINKSLNYII